MYYNNPFGAIIALPNKEAIDYAVDLAKRAKKVTEGEEEKPEGFPESFTDILDSSWFEVEALEGNKLNVESEGGNPDPVAVFLQHLLQRYLPNGHLALEWSDSRGGGAAIIAANKITFINTNEWLEENLSKMNGEQLNEAWYG